MPVIEAPSIAHGMSLGGVVHNNHITSKYYKPHKYAVFLMHKKSRNYCITQFVIKTVFFLKKRDKIVNVEKCKEI